MRRNRIKSQGATYLVTANINRFKEEIIEEDVKQNMLSVMNKAKSLFTYILFNFSIQNDCVKWIIKPTKNQDLSKIMQYVLSVFAIRYNKRYKIHGHVWYDRFDSIIINDFKKIDELMNEFKEFPVVKKLVEKAEEYIFGGFYYLEKKIYLLVEPINRLTFEHMNL
jgi:putative transposase